MLDWNIYFGLYFIAGLSLKIGDDLLDVLNRPRHAWLPLILTGLAAGRLLSNSQWDAALLTAILMGVLIAGKVDRPQFVAVLFIAPLIMFIVGPPLIMDLLQWCALIVILLLAGAIDEIGNDWADRRARSRITWFFAHRFTMKICALLLCIVLPMFLSTAIGMWIFDAGYETSRILSKSRMNMQIGKTTTHIDEPRDQA